MNEPITPEMIDWQLTEKICLSINAGRRPVDYESAYGVKCVLAWLANNPIEPAEGQVEELRKRFYDQAIHSKSSLVFGAINFPSIAYLKKEDPIPQELKDIYAKHGFCSADVMDALQKAYKLGKGESK